MGIFDEVAKGLSGIGSEIVRQVTGKKPKKHQRQYRNLNRYTSQELSQFARDMQKLTKDVYKNPRD